MRELFKRFDKGSELTWEELDTNWMRIKNGVDELEQELANSRINKEWILPLYLSGDAESENTRLDAMLGYGGIIYEDDNGFVSVFPFGVYGEYENYFLNNNFNIDEPSFELSIYTNSPYTGTALLLNQTTITMRSEDDIFFQAERISGLSFLGFWGEKAERQSIAETSSDPAITELQDILIAYGLAIDNRS